MKKILFAILAIGLLLVVSCQKTETKPIPNAKPAVQPSVVAVEDKAVDSVGSAIADVDTIDQDLNADDMKDIDSGLDDIQSI